MCHSCVSSSPGSLVPAPVLVSCKGNSDNMEFYFFWIPTFVGMTPFSRLRFAQPASPAGGEASRFIRLKCYRFP